MTAVQVMQAARESHWRSRRERLALGNHNLYGYHETGTVMTQLVEDLQEVGNPYSEGEILHW